MSERYLAEFDIAWQHPDDNPPPHGTKLLLYMYPHGVAVIGEFQNSGARLWAPLPSVPRELRGRLKKEMTNHGFDYV